MERENKRYGDGKVIQVLFANGILAAYDASKPAEVFISDWNGVYLADPRSADSAHFNISARVLDSNTVEFTGRVTGETVQMRIVNGNDRARSRTYTSSNPSNPEYRFENPPRSCPNPEWPAWFGAFMRANQKQPPVAAEKSAPRDGDPARNGDFRDFWAGSRVSL